MDDSPKLTDRENLRAFADGRRKYLLDHPEIKKLAEK